MMTVSAAAPSTQAAAIRVHALRYTYPGAHAPALDGIDFEVPAGEIFGLLGPNGAGKSTLLSLLSGALDMQAGDVTIAGEPLTQRARRIKQISAVVPQEYAFYESLTGLQNLDYFGQVFGLSRVQLAQRREQAIATCQLESHIDRPAIQYSGGLKRRLNLAIGLLNAPQILYLDEPTVGIDAESRRFIIDAVYALKTAGTTIVYTSHYMEEVEALCDSLAVINEGQLVLHDRMENLLRREGGQTLQVTLRAPDPNVARLFAGFEATHVDYKVWTLTVPQARVSEVLNTLERAGKQVDRLQYGVSRLEKIYLDLLLRGSAPEGDA